MWIDEVSMKRMFLTTMALAFSLSSLAAQPSSAVGDVSNLTAMTLIESKNHNLMSSYKDYSQARQQSRQLKQSLAQQQYSQFVQLKQTSGLPIFETTAR